MSKHHPHPTSMMMLSSASIMLPLIELLFLAKQSHAFLSTTILLFSSKSQRQSQFQEFSNRPSVDKKSSLSLWNKIAEYDVNGASYALFDIDDVSAIAPTIAYQKRDEFCSSPFEFNLASPREWLEYCEVRQTREPTQQREDGDSQRNLECREQGGGAYTVMRCDFLLDDCSWRIWGKDFHFNRLRESYRSLVRQMELSRGRSHDADEKEPNEAYEKTALDSSLEVLNLLLAEAKVAILCNNDVAGKDSSQKGRNMIVTVMITLLWCPYPNDSQISDSYRSGIQVQGHAYSAMKTSQMYSDGDLSDTGDNTIKVDPNPNAPVQAVIGYLTPSATERIRNHKNYNYNYNHNSNDSVFLPDRYNNYPQAKLSSWCRQRRPLEEIFKKKNVGDVILTKHSDENDVDNKSKSSSSSVLNGAISTESKPSVELLEGLTSNLFVVYPGNIIRTAPSTHVLGGYVRQLIINCAENCGYKMEFDSISLADAHLWEEVFLTSSIRLIIPVYRLSLPNFNILDCEVDDLLQLGTLWEISSNEEGKSKGLIASNVLYNKLVNHVT